MQESTIREDFSLLLGRQNIFPWLQANNLLHPLIIAVGGGKGGTGKSLIVANLGMELAQTGLNIVLVDADINGANLHTCLGLKPPDISLLDFLHHRVQHIKDTIVETSVNGLCLISGVQDLVDSTNFKYTYKQEVLSSLRNIDADIILMDLGSGTLFNVLDFFLASDLGLVVTAPEPTSSENVYWFIKNAYYRLLWHKERSAHFRKIIKEASARTNEHNIRTPFELIHVVAKMDPARGDAYQAWMLAFRPLLVVNQVRTTKDKEFGRAVSAVCRKYYGIEFDYIGYIMYDDIVWKSIRNRSCVMHSYPDSKFVENIYNIAEELKQRLKKDETSKKETRDK